MSDKRATIMLKSGGAVLVANTFILGNGIAGDIAGAPRWFSDEDIDRVIEHPGPEGTLIGCVGAQQEKEARTGRGR